MNLPSIVSLRQKTSGNQSDPRSLTLLQHHNRATNRNSTSTVTSDVQRYSIKTKLQPTNRSQMRAIHNSIINNRLQLSNHHQRRNHEAMSSPQGLSKIKCFHCNHDFPSKRLLQVHINQFHPGLPMGSSTNRNTVTPAHCDRDHVSQSQLALNVVMKMETDE